MVRPRGRGELVPKNKQEKLKPKAQILVFPEGYTERIYLLHLDHRKYNLEIVIRDSDHTDAHGIVFDAVKYLKDYRIEREFGDRVYCMFDADRGSNPPWRLETAVEAAVRNGIEIIFSNPCIEVWYYMHFADAPNCSGGKEMKAKLRRDFIPRYHETMDVYNRLLPLQGDARRRAAELHEKQKRKHDNLLNQDCRPYCNVHLFLDELDRVEREGAVHR